MGEKKQKKTWTWYISFFAFYWMMGKPCYSFFPLFLPLSFFTFKKAMLFYIKNWFICEKIIILLRDIVTEITG